MSSGSHRAPRIAVPGTFNFRDVGGYATQDGGSVATGRLYRADGLGRLGEPGVRLLRDLRIGSVIDLREEMEVRNIPDALDGLGARYTHLPLLGNRYFPLDEDIPDRIVLDPHTLPSLYAATIETAGTRFVEVITHVAQEQDGAVVFHCSAGKDRTGLTAAFILTLLGVDRDTVIADYALTEEYLGEDFRAALRSHFSSAGISTVSTMATEAKPQWLADVLDRLDHDHGGVEGYLADHGMADGVVARLRTHLIAAEGPDGPARVH